MGFVQRSEIYGGLSTSVLTRFYALSASDLASDVQLVPKQVRDRLVAAGRDDEEEPSDYGNGGAD